MKAYRLWLVLDSEGHGRVISRWPYKLKGNEIAMRLNVSVPDGWGSIRGALDVTLPDPPTATVDLGETVTDVSGAA